MQWPGTHLWVVSSWRDRLRPARRTLWAAARAGVLFAALAALSCPVAAGPAAASPLPRDLGAVTGLHETTSHYEVNARAGRLYRQGVAAGKADEQGIVILDFGRPADNGLDYGTIDFDDQFVSLGEITRAVEFFISGYYRFAPAYTTLEVAIGTNNSCGTGQPCGDAVCGCTDEPPDYFVWGQQLAAIVERTGWWSSYEKQLLGYTDTVGVVAADDAEPAYDPEYLNTYDLLQGYAEAVGGTSPAMVDYGSAESHYWTENELLQVAYGFAPDVAMPEIYYRIDAAEWAQLLRYAKDTRDEMVHIFGVLSGGPGTNSPQAAYSDMLAATAGITNQVSIPWVSTIAPPRVPLTG